MYQLVANSAFDNTQAQFAFQTVNSNVYLRLGLLNSADDAFVDTLIAGGYVGFFESDTLRAKAQILARNHATNGLQIDSQPSLTVGMTYDIRFTQARSGVGVSQASSRDEILGMIQGYTLPFTLEYRDRLVNLNVLPANATNVLAAINAMTTEQLRAAYGALTGTPPGTTGTLTYTNRNFILNSGNSRPSGMAYYSEIVYVADQSGLVYRYNLAGAYQNSLNANLGSNLTSITYVTPDSRFWINRHSVSAIYRRDFGTSSIPTFNKTASNTDASGMAYIPPLREVWIADAVQARIFRYATVSPFGAISDYVLHVDNGHPTALAYVSSVNEVWVLDTNAKVYRYSTTGTYIGVYTLYSDNGTPTGMVHIPTDNVVWISDDVDNRIYEYTPPVAA